MKVATPREARLTAYVLGTLPEDEAERVELDFFANDDAYDDLLAVEDELFLAYARGELPADDRLRVEQRLIRTARDRSRLEWSRTLAAWFDRESGRAAAGARVKVPGAGFQVPGVQYLLPIAALIAVAFGWLAMQNQSLRREVEEARQARASAEQALMGARRGAADRDALAKRVEELQAAQPQPANPGEPGGGLAPLVLSLSLTPGLVRGTGRLPGIDLPEMATGVLVTLSLPAGLTARPFQAGLLNSDGRTIWTGRAIVSGTAVVVDLPASGLARGDYALVLRDPLAGSESPGVAEYHFAVFVAPSRYSASPIEQL